MGRFEEKVFDWIESQALFADCDNILLAVSGGADSVAMVHALVNLKSEGLLSCDFIMGHVNHHLRGADSDGDQAFVSQLGRQLEIEVVTTSVPVRQYAEANKLSIETAGRTLRLKALAAMAQENDCDMTATAHHTDDQAETMIHRLMRGTGFRGLCGIWPISEVYEAEFVRPMLAMRRTEIIQYCTENNLSWRQDASNQNIDFTRNRIRHRLLPVLQSDSETIVERLSVLSYKSRRFLLRTEKHAASILVKGRLNHSGQQFVLDKGLLSPCPPWVFYEVMCGALVRIDVGLRNYKKEHFDLFRQLIDSPKAKADFPGDVELVVEKGSVSVQVKKQKTALPKELITAEIGKTVQFGPWEISCQLLNADDVDFDSFKKTKNAFVEWLDAEKVVGPIQIRYRQDGDRFRPIGGKGEKKVGRFLIDAGLGPQMKNQAFIVKDVQKILWLAPVRMSELAKVTPKTTGIVEIRVDSIIRQEGRV